MAKLVSLSHLLDRGDKLEIKKGILVIEAKSGKPIPADWFKENQLRLIREIVGLTGHKAFSYIGYKTGEYGSKRASGVCLQFEELQSLKEAFVVFNCDLKRTRNTQSGKAGTPLPKKHFRVTRKAKFYKFWCKTGLLIPSRLSKWHDYMGNLKKVSFTGTFTEGEKLSKDSLTPLEIDFKEIAECYDRNIKYNNRTIPTQNTNKFRTTVPHKESEQTLVSQSVAQDSHTGFFKYGNKVIREADVRCSVIPFSNRLDVRNQTTQEWLADYE